MDCNYSETASSVGHERQDPRFPFSDVPLILAIVADRGTMCRMVVMQSDLEVIVDHDQVLPRAVAFRPSMTQKGCGIQPGSCPLAPRQADA